MKTDKKARWNVLATISCACEQLELWKSVQKNSLKF